MGAVRTGLFGSKSSGLVDFYPTREKKNPLEQEISFPSLFDRNDRQGVRKGVVEVLETAGGVSWSGGLGQSSSSSYGEETLIILFLKNPTVISKNGKSTLVHRLPPL